MSAVPHGGPDQENGAELSAASRPGPQDGRLGETPLLHVAARKRHPPRTVEQHHDLDINGRIAKVVTEAVGTMWCAYAFAALALIALPSAIRGGALSIVQWISQTFLQLVLLSVIMVGQKVIGRASDERALQAYNDAEAVLHEAQQIQAHLAAQDAALEEMRRRLNVDLSAPQGPSA